MKRFHVHIYFEPDNLEVARLLTDCAQQTGLFEFVKLHERPIGPHPTGMIEGHFGEVSYILALDWLEANRGSFSVLVHSDTGDDFKDHTVGALWLGKEMSLDFNFFK